MNSGWLIFRIAPAHIGENGLFDRCVVQCSKMLLVLEDHTRRGQHTPMHEVALQAEDAGIICSVCTPTRFLVPLVVCATKGVEIRTGQLLKRLAHKGE